MEPFFENILYYTSFKDNLTYEDNLNKVYFEKLLLVANRSCQKVKIGEVPFMYSIYIILMVWIEETRLITMMSQPNYIEVLCCSSCCWENLNWPYLLLFIQGSIRAAVQNKLNI